MVSREWKGKKDNYVTLELRCMLVSVAAGWCYVGETNRKIMDNDMDWACWQKLATRPCAMQGRDVVGIAETGQNLAFVRLRNRGMPYVPIIDQD